MVVPFQSKGEISMIRKSALLFASGLCLASLAIAQPSVQWGSAARPVAARQAIEGMKTFYEPEKVEKNGSVQSVTLYRSASPGAADEAGRYMINCDTREVVTVVKGQATPPVRVIAGEELYPLGKKLCDWDPKSFFKKILE
jgi:hypothetical protein